MAVQVLGMEAGQTLLQCTTGLVLDRQEVRLSEGGAPQGPVVRGQQRAWEERRERKG